MNLRYPFYAALVAVASLTVTFLVSAVALPRMTRVLGETNYPHVIGPIAAAIESATGMFYYCFGFHIVAALLVAAMVVIPLRRLPEKLRHLARRFLMVASVLLFASAILAMFAQLVFSMEANSALKMQVKSYHRTLEEFALVETAEGHLEKVNEGFRAFLSQEVVFVDSVDDFSRLERRQQVARLSKLLRPETQLKGTSIPYLKKSVLATLLLFREDVKPNSSAAKLIVEEVERITGKGIGTINEAFDWIESQEKSDGWMPLPLMRIVPRKSLR